MPDIGQSLIIFAVLLFSLTVHEMAHAVTADWLGDPTARRLGRISLNPAVHIDPVGTIMLPLLGLVAGGFVFGWAKPVPVDPRKFRNYRSGDIKVSLAGIVSNLILAILFTVVALVLVKMQAATGGGGPVLGFLIRTARFGIFINLILAVFNLIPIPPLDGSHVMYHLLPRQWGAKYRQVGRYGMLVLMGLIYFYPPFLTFVLWPVLALMGLADTLVDLWI